MDMQTIIQFCTNVGVFGALFVWLLIKTQSESRAREEKLMAALDKYAGAFEKLSTDVAEIKQDVEELKNK